MNKKSSDRKQEGEKIPKTEKGMRMRDKILASAKEVFSEYGYFAARIVDITEKAGISEGNFYRYFNNKEEVLIILVKEMMSELYAAGRTRDIEGSYYTKLVESTKRLFRAYLKNAGIYRVLTQVANYDREFYRLWRELRSPFVRRIRKDLDKMNLSEHLDKDYVATALSSMASHFAYIWCVLGGEEIEKTFDVDSAAETVATLWYNALTKAQTGEKLFKE